MLEIGCSVALPRTSASLLRCIFFGWLTSTSCCCSPPSATDGEGSGEAGEGQGSEGGSPGGEGGISRTQASWPRGFTDVPLPLPT